MFQCSHSFLCHGSGSSIRLFLCTEVGHLCLEKQTHVLGVFVMAIPFSWNAFPSGIYMAHLLPPGLCSWHLISQIFFFFFFQINVINSIIVTYFYNLSVWLNRRQLDSHRFCIVCFATCLVEVYQENPAS